MTDDTPRDAALERLLDALPREIAPPPEFPDRVLGALRERGLVRERHVPAWRLAAAATVIFAAGVAAGVGGASLVERPTAPITRVAVTDTGAPSSFTQRNVPDVGQGEVWY